MSTSLGLARRRPPVFADWAPWSNLFGLNEDARRLAEDFHWGGHPLPAVEIPFDWLRPPVRIRLDTPLNVAEVSQADGDTARSTDAASISGNGGREWRFSESIDSIVAADAVNLAKWITDYYDTQRPRCARLAFVLNDRAHEDIWRILGVTAGRRIAITDAPAGWPTGAAELVVEGVRHSILADLRTVEWITTPVIGAEVGEVGPWFYADDSRTDGTDVVPF